MLCRSAALLLVVTLTNANYLTPVHLQPAHQAFIRRSEVISAPDGFAPFRYPLTQKQDNVFLTKAYSSSSVQSSILAAVSDNPRMAAAAILEGKTKPRSGVFNLGALGAVENILPLRKRDSPAFRWDYDNAKIRGVNLGGWLVLEPWITPSLFVAAGNNSAVDEWTFSEGLGKIETLKRLMQHWDTWITEDDIALIASYGLNHVRIPIGFWALDVSVSEPYVQGQYPYLMKAVGWCQEHGIRVIIDLHGAPGSQNGFDNSGRRGDIHWNTDTTNVNRTLDVIQTLASEFSQPQYERVVTAIQILNEPAGFFSEDLLNTYKQFSYDGYGIVRYPGGNQSSTLTLTLHDAFEPLDSWRGFMPAPDFQGVLLDTHVYTIFSNENAGLSEQDRISAICNMSSYLATSQTNLWTVVGEWSPAPNDCAGSLNGRGAGSRYDGTYPGSTAVGSCNGFTGRGAGFSPSYKAFLRRFFEVQVSVYEESTSGWLMWTWKTENADEWSYKAGVAGGWIPTDPSAQLYGNQCAS